ncbi:MAG: hypothetical protein ACJ79S_09230 [Gemmatimonadaceae bacterium]
MPATAPLPPVPWQLTGNHWLSLPCIHPADGALHAVGVVHRGARAAIEFAGTADFMTGAGPALARPSFFVNGARTELAGEGLAWERALGWLPTFTCTMGPLVVRGTVFAPHGRDADVAGAAYSLAVENRGGADVDVAVALEGVLGHRQQRVRTPRAFDDAHQVLRGEAEVVVLEGSARPGLVAIAIGADGPAEVEIGGDADAPSYAIRRTLRVAAGAREHFAFYLAAGPERDGAEATVAVMRRRGWRELLAATRDALQTLEQATGNEAVDRLLNRNLLFAYFYAVARGLDDAHYYLVRTRAPWHARGVTVRDWEALAWTVPAVQLADAALARELLLRACELHGYAPGNGEHYLDGTLFAPGFSLEGAASYALAVDRYIRETGDDQVVEEPVLADTLYLSSDDIAARRDRAVPLYSTEVSPAGSPPAYPYTLHGNAVAALALDVFRRTLDEETARDVEDPEAVRAALRRHFATEREGKTVLAASTDLAEHVSLDDDPLASALWLPMYETLDRQDSTYRRTVRGIGAEPHYLAQQCAKLIGPDSTGVLQWFRRAPLDNGVAAEVVDAEGRATANGGDASLAGLLAHTLWYAVHALGLR